ncbi:type II toxin-antitoxin system Phd/YefM family antitoxin [Georgenia sp. Z1491]|uniref:type II toxin-antitoxin system Phd/YefM family antitoxin n=1 Tax=Georgenia sp. Z1491 TaxID=3416707 RepID=UPI003CEF83FC
MVTNVSHRDLRNRSGEVLHAVAAGESYTVTNRGKPVARLVPIAEAADSLPLHRPASIRGEFSHLPRHVIATPSADSIDDLRGER